MAILANSVSVTHTTGASGETKTGYVAAERISLSLEASGDSYAWELSVPSGSAVARSALSDDDAATASFTPDVAGSYTVRCVVDGDTFILYLTVTLATVSQLTGGVRFLPVTDTSIATPSAGVVLYFSSTQDALSIKDSDGDVFTVDLTAV